MGIFKKYTFIIQWTEGYLGVCIHYAGHHVWSCFRGCCEHYMIPMRKKVNHTLSWWWHLKRSNFDLFKWFEIFNMYMQVWYRVDKYIIKNKQNQCKFWYHRRLLLLSQPPSPALRLLLLKKFGSKLLNYHWNISKNCIWDNMGVEGPR